MDEVTAPNADRAISARREGYRLSRRGLRWSEKAIHSLLLFSALASILITIGIVVFLLNESLFFFRQVSLREFLTGTRWAPLFRPQHFGVLPLVSGTLLTAGIAILVALPVGLASAIFLSEYAPERFRRLVKPALEVLAGIPTVVYGYFALTLVTPLLKYLFPGISVFNALSAGVVMGVMIIPMVSSLSEDAMMAVPRSLREAGYALGATRLEVATRVVFPAAFSGIVAASLLALSRAVGETMIVAIAAGATPRITLNPLEGIQTMTAYIVQISLGETPHGTIEYSTIFAVGILLFLLTLIINLLGQHMVARYREKY